MRGDLGRAQRPPELVRGHDAHVLVVQVDAEAGAEVAGQYGFPLQVEDLAAREATGEDIQALGGVRAQALHEHDRLGEEA
ncbi:hypothetical protein NSK11_contig00068-0008 [Nocardia seriolae]|uniref:Uncharacterized protein n=1 Tax=Nocardia seriolae TaxID=37332 RepID=A0ABC9YY89_9NOCA|nr:hypothetical protein NSERKGN1266_50980 [Nocardia seriolae]BEK95402.1 hypothetical protein NSER024013_33080 [Nocardia seriolae]GAM48011.1 hypothetical protein NS07_v2contig00063-0008 [Nocardia seriolae]GAP29918.1 hypothetical protein NSK11_contig00068-0008 [Nocardia seriolae]GEM25738.1 hypothetical protein NS2_39770 [Nocardia seriolae NBRC 15557]